MPLDDVSEMATPVATARHDELPLDTASSEGTSPPG